LIAKIRLMKLTNIYCLIVLIAISSCNTKSQKASLGDLNYKFNISDEAKESFDNGLLLLHSFEYEDARGEFKKAKEKDSTEIMAYWGEAMSHYRALWGLENIEKGRAVMAKIGSTKEKRLEKISDPLEYDFWRGLEILYGEGKRIERHKSYSKHMSQVYEKRPDNQEVAAFYALGLMWSVNEGRDDDVFSRSAEVAASVLEENPTHPGGLHYMIHAYDDPEYAKYAKAAADNYAKVAPDATHALHMPSHIYVALGMWNEVVSSNENSYAASLNRMNRKELDGSARGYHSYAWLHYGYLQQGRYQKAADLLRDMRKYNQEVNNTSTQSYLIVMQAAQLSETGSFEGFDYYSADYKKLGVTDKARQHFSRAYLAFQNSESDIIQAEIDTVSNFLVSAELSAGEGGVTVCSAGPSRYLPNKYDIYETKAMVQQMETFIDLLKNNIADAESHLKAAVDLEKQSGYSFGPPAIPLPTYEQYAAFLIKQSLFEDALKQVDLSLDQAPKRANALKMKEKILKELGREEEAQIVREQRSVFWKDNEVTRV